MTDIHECIIPNRLMDPVKENYYQIISSAGATTGAYTIYEDKLPDLLTSLLGTDYLVATAKLGGNTMPVYDIHIYYAKSERKGGQYYFTSYKSGPVLNREGVLVFDKCISDDELVDVMSRCHSSEHETSHIFDVKLDERDDFTAKELGL